MASAAIEVPPTPQAPPPPPTDSSARRLDHARKPSLRRVQDSRENLHQRRGNKSSKAAAPDWHEPSASRGREFRAGNIGNNGLIYLRPVQRQPQISTHPLAFPPVATPPANLPEPSSHPWRSSVASGTTTRHSILSTSSPRATRTPLRARLGHRHARSASKNDFEAPSPAAQGTFKVVIDRASQSQAPSYAKTLESLSIPHYRLGTPHFTDKGSAVLQSSINTGSSKRDHSFPNVTQEHGRDIRSSPRGDAFQPGAAKLSPSTLKRNLHRVQSKEQATSSASQGQGPQQTQVVKLNAHQQSNHAVSEIRVSTATGQLLAASIPQLIAQITSPRLLDYELLSDFFLTYRQFMTPSDLATRLVERLQTAIRSADEFSRIVRVRTFVALRHWILNYFVDDFVSNFDLRARFCVLVNKLCRSLERDSPQRMGDLRIIEELKKCWRHTCALFWDVLLMPDPELPHEDILPGGHLGSRSTPADWDEGHLGGSGSQLDLQGEGTPREPSPADSFEAPEFAFNQTHKLGSSTTSSASSVSGTPGEERQSIQATSCSLPPSVFPGHKHQRDPSLGPRPLPSFSRSQKQPTQPPSSAENARKHHSRSGSFSDALRDDRAPLPTPKLEGNDPTPTAMMVPGSLIRGATVSPGMPYVEAVIAASPTQETESFDFQPLQLTASVDQRGRQIHSPSPGVRRFIGTMRRALSAKNATGRARSSSPGRGRDETRVPSSPFRTPPKREPSAQKRKLVDGRAALRIDMLAAEVQESFKAAVQQVQEAQEAFQCQHFEQPPHPRGEHSVQEQHNLHMLQIPRQTVRDTSVTEGSRSIVIMDDTNGQLTPQAQVRPADNAIALVTSQVSLMQPHGPGVQSVPVFFDKGHTEPTESLDDETEFYTDSTTADTYNWPATDEPQLAASPSSEAPDILQIPRPDDLLSPQVTETEVSSSHGSFEGATAMTDDTQTSTNDPFHLERMPARQLRRLPAGNLRAANHVHSLDQHSQSDVARGTSSILYAPPEIPPRMSSTNAAGTDVAPSMTLTNEQSDAASQTSQPPMRPSFEREVAKLAQLPDTADADNGIESALAKLEGRGESSPASDPPPDFLEALNAEGVEIDGAPLQPQHTQSEANDTRRGLHRENEVVQLHGTSNAVDAIPGPPSQLVVQHKPISMTESSALHSSIPLLERGASHPPRRKTYPKTPEMPMSSKSGSQETYGAPADSFQTSETMPGSEESYELVDEDESLQRARAGKKPVLSERTHQSFLLNDNETLSELSSLTPDGTSADGNEKSPGMKSFFNENGDSGRNTPRRLDSSPPPRPSESASVIPRPQNPTPQSPTDKNQVDPAYVPGTRSRETSSARARVPGASPDERQHSRARSSPLTHAPSAAHLPYILAHDSLALAQQFTVIERDALCEIDWRDLIDLQWNQTATAYYNWVDYLRSSNMIDAHGNPVTRPGVDMCIARFNLVVRWVKSEVVLTQDITERVATIVKYIHVAQHARKLRNWATMYQISMALVSADMSRLKQTWAMVPEVERDALAQLEDLIMPKRNFHNLRIEIEKATSTWAQGGEGGCIPFIGIYTHDLIYNAQKPAKVRTNPRGALVDATNLDVENGQERGVLINFERQHTAATIVKNLLRLIEASSKYSFQPDSEITSRCLWIGALHDAEVTRRSKELEGPFERSSA